MHTYEEVFEKLGLNFDDYIGESKMKNLRAAAFNVIVSEKFDRHIFELLGYKKDEIDQKIQEFRMPG